VFAFEPSAYARSVLRPALRWNRIRNVEIVPIGLSDADGVSVLRTPIKSGGGMGFGLANLGSDPGTGAVAEQAVALTTLDGFAAGRGLKRLDFVKADVEGWETHVLRGAGRMLQSCRPTLFLEVVETSLSRAGTAPAEIWHCLSPLGYHAFKAPDFRPVTAFDGPGDYLFVTEAAAGTRNPQA
jgi:FkbM family methyltransferase